MDGSDYEDNDYDDYSDADPMSDSEDYGFDPSAEVLTTSRKNPYRVLTKLDVARRRTEAIEEVTSVLGLTTEDAERVLRKFKWDLSRVHEEWFTKYDEIRSSLGLVDDAMATTSGTAEEKCQICFESFPKNTMLAAACQHYFCQECYKGYVVNAIGQGPPVLDLRCPLPDCKAAVPYSIIQQVCDAMALLKYNTFAMRSFVEDSRNMCWCVGANCENTIEALIERAQDDPLDVICTCAATFCFNCKEEAHRPVLCATVKKWITKNSAESENLNWILANTKPCPKCQRPIEKNQGCMHMTCSQCKFEFCWLCQGAWTDHGERTGGFYACNRYETGKKQGSYDEEAKRRDNAKASLERYMHYFERWDAHNKAREKAKSDRENVTAQRLDKLSDLTKTPTSQLKFINDAWNQIIECRRMLKWTYAFGYYAFEDDKPEIAQQREFFEFLQADAEHSLEKLHEMSENSLKKLVESAGGPGNADTDKIIREFQDFRKRLIGLTDVTHSFFEKLVKQLEHGIGDMEAMYATTEPTPEMDLGGPSTSKGPGADRALKSRRSKRTRMNGAPSSQPSGELMDEGDLLSLQGFWTCQECTFHNKLGSTACEMCQTPKPSEE